MTWAYQNRLIFPIDISSDGWHHISAVYEIEGSIKVQHYVPGTRIPILPERDLYLQDMNLPILNLAWHIPDEVRANLASHGYTGQVIDIKDYE